MRHPFRLNTTLSTIILLWSAGAAHAQVFDPFAPLEAGDFKAAAVGDLNSDGHADLLVFRPSTVSDIPPTWEIKLNDGSGRFTPSFSLEQGLGSGPLIIADVNDDGHADIVIPDGFRVRIFWNGGAGQSF